MKEKKRLAFTLIEMLIVIVIIGILAAALVPRLQSVQARARDAKRRADANQIYSAMNIFYNDNSYLRTPVGVTYYGWNDYGGWDFSSQSGWVGWSTLFVNYLQTAGILTSVPVDPINNLSGATMPGAWMYAYQYYCYPSANPWLYFSYYLETPTGVLK